MMKDPPRPFHVSFAEQGSDGRSTQLEGEITAGSIDYTERQSSRGKTVTQKKRLARGQVTDLDIDFVLMGPVPWHGELAPIESSAQPEGSEEVNGYRTTKYSFDSADESPAEKATFLSLMRDKDYRIRGSAWAEKETGCLVKYQVHLEEDAQDGSVKKTDFEGDVTKQ